MCTYIHFSFQFKGSIPQVILVQRNNSLSDNNVYLDSSPSIEDNTSVGGTSERKVHIHNKLGNWYSPLCNRWFSLLGVSILLHRESLYLF